MAREVLFNPYCSINSVDLSEYVQSITINGTVDDVEITAGGDEAKARGFGFKDWTASITFRQDFAASKVDATLWPLLGTSFAVEFRAHNTTVGAGNPKFTSAGGGLFSYSPLEGSVGDAHNASVDIKCADGIMLVRSIGA